MNLHDTMFNVKTLCRWWVVTSVFPNEYKTNIWCKHVWCSCAVSLLYMKQGTKAVCFAGSNLQTDSRLSYTLWTHFSFYKCLLAAVSSCFFTTRTRQVLFEKKLLLCFCFSSFFECVTVLVPLRGVCVGKVIYKENTHRSIELTHTTWWKFY